MMTQDNLQGGRGRTRSAIPMIPESVAAALENIRTCALSGAATCGTAPGFEGFTVEDARLSALDMFSTILEVIDAYVQTRPLWAPEAQREDDLGSKLPGFTRHDFTRSD